MLFNALLPAATLCCPRHLPTPTLSTALQTNPVFSVSPDGSQHFLRRSARQHSLYGFAIQIIRLETGAVQCLTDQSLDLFWRFTALVPEETSPMTRVWNYFQLPFEFPNGSWCAHPKEDHGNAHHPFVPLSPLRQSDIRRMSLLRFSLATPLFNAQRKQPGGFLLTTWRVDWLCSHSGASHTQRARRCLRRQTNRGCVIVLWLDRLRWTINPQQTYQQFPGHKGNSCVLTGGLMLLEATGKKQFSIAF